MMALTSAAVALAAGVLSILSPCVLPLLPVVLGAAVAEGKRGPAALAIGLALSFTAIGLFVAAIGFSLGLEAAVFRSIAAAFLVAIGVVLVLPFAQIRLAVAAGPMGNWVEQRFGGFSVSGLRGQFALGLLLGALWSPCVGPTLRAASLMAARGEGFLTVAAVMGSFGVGAALPLIAFGMLSRDALLRWRGRMAAAGTTGKLILGATLVAIGLSILSGLDRLWETALVDISPQWLTDLTTRF
ncbi:cytochrome c biogenesis CcdA family protein [Methylocapsa aurea]|uniref:cytochrome c biogenesis CcdA family protein n=1 Tax=Methylocapsa aurea TaxID=663610 RepID=UPI001FD89556|nr:cytochrome c biogenesis protein CcdA [Methylocapsa aurea]